MIEIFTLALAANESREVAKSGEYFEVRNALFLMPLIELLDRSGGVVARLENMEQSDFVKPGRYETVRVTNGPTAQVVRMFCGSGDAGSRRTSGLVRIDGESAVLTVDQPKRAVLLGAAYEGLAGAIGVAATNTRLQLHNPAASGKNLIVMGVSVSSDVAADFTAFPTASVFGSVMVDSKANRFHGMGAGGSVAQLRWENVAAAAGGALLGKFASHYLQARQIHAFDMRDPYVVSPGFALAIQGPLAATLNAVFKWSEEAV